MAETPIFRRSAGILLHPTSLPSPYGIGDLGEGARVFIDWLAGAKASLWQILPLVPPGQLNSPYFATSAFASNPLLLDFQWLTEHRLLEGREYAQPVGALDHVEFDAVKAFKMPRLNEAADRFLRDSAHPLRIKFDAFLEREAWWLNDAALFSSLAEEEGTSEWWRWSEPLRERQPKAIQDAREDLSERVNRFNALQFFFDQQWNALRAYARDRGIKTVGDMPIYVSTDSADVWANKDQFTVGSDGATALAGVPPDDFSADGQLWGSCLYRWDRVEKTGFRWWIDRLQRTLKQTDYVRIDHFRGFESYWEIPAHTADPKQGRWCPGPGLKLFDALKEALGVLPVIAEDLGIIDEPVRKLRKDVGLPGMRVLQFAFGQGAGNEHLPHNHSQDSVVYTGTHDNDTTASWWEEADDDIKAEVQAYLGGPREDIVGEMIRTTLASVGDTAVLPMQDLLRLGGNARMNNPADPVGNWGWRVRADAFNKNVSEPFAKLVKLYGRAPERAEPKP